MNLTFKKLVEYLQQSLNNEKGKVDKVYLQDELHFLKLLLYVVENTNDLIFIQDKDHNLLFINKYGLLLLECEFDEILKTDLSHWVDEAERGKLRGYLYQLSQNRSFRFQTVLKNKYSVKIPVEVNAVFIEEGDKSYYGGIIRDITEQKKVEKNLMESQEKFKRLVEEHQMLFGQWL